jgi:hypothetical protein
MISKRFWWSRGSVLAFSTQVRGFKPGRRRLIFKSEKILTTPSFGGEEKPSVPCRRFAACKRSLNGVEVVILAKLLDNILAHNSTFRRWGSLASWQTWGHLVAKVGTSKRGGKQWRTTPKNLPRMQRTRAIPVAWLSSGLCSDQPKGWIPTIINYEFLHVSGDYGPIIRRNNCVFATLVTCYYVWMTVWYAGCTMHTRFCWFCLI